MNTKIQLRLLPCLAAITAAAIMSASAGDKTVDNPGQLTASDYKFAKEAACGGMFEVNLGNIAQANSSNPAVQQFGKQMATDHGKAGQELTQLASQKGATLPTQLSPKHQKEVDRLSKMTGPAFDKAYVAEMIKAHKMDEKLFKHASEHANDADLRAFAGTTLTVVQMHLRMAEQMEPDVKHELSSNNQ